MKKTRTYTMTSRAEAAERTRLRILDAAVELSSTTLVSEISLEAIASTAEVSVQTLLRRFGNRSGLLAAAREHARTVIADERRAPVGDVAAAVRAVVDHYEHRGDAVILMLAQERADEQIREITDDGRRFHARWVQEVFAPYLPAGRVARDERVALLVVATDIYTWKLLRRDQGAGRAVTEQRMERLVRAVLDLD
ncbi:MAG TPA: TetR family transcriptional regulator [Nocardioides sp.]|nr:TetR family transcriptional regulator [Nocardioides sp.]